MPVSLNMAKTALDRWQQLAPQKRQRLVPLAKPGMLPCLPR